MFVKPLKVITIVVDGDDAMLVSIPQDTQWAADKLLKAWEQVQYSAWKEQSE